MMKARMLMPVTFCPPSVDDVVLDDRQNALDNRGLDGKHREADTTMESANAFTSSTSRLRKIFHL